MLQFYVTLQDQNGSEFPPPRDLILTPQRPSANTQGGSDQVEIAVSGPKDPLWSILRWLSYRIQVRNRNGSVIWSGYIHEAEVTQGAMSVGLSLTGMYNRVRAAYTTTVNGSSEDGMTDWAQDAESIARYGQKEHLLTLSDVTLTQANYRRDTKLAASKYPSVTRKVGRGGAQMGGVLRCRGLMETLGWRYYTNLAGLEENSASGNATQPLGWGLTDTTIGFTNDGKVHDLTGRMNNFVDNTGITIAGSTSNNGTRVVSQVDNREPQSYTATTIYFDVVDDVLDTEDGFGFVQTSDYITISGAPGATNNGTFRCKSASADHLVVKPAVIGNEPAGNTVTISRGNYLQTDTSGVHETVGDTVTITGHGQKIAQSFSLGYNANWTVERVVIRIQKVGTPSDNVTVGIYSDSAGLPGTLIEAASVASSAISTNMGWVAFVLTNVNTLSYGTTYWIVISRSGSNSPTDFYLVDMDEELSYSRGALTLYDGSTWVGRIVDADLIFQVMGSVITTTQISSIVTDVGSFLAGTIIETASAIGGNQYRNGETTALDEVTALLELGTSSNKPLFAEVTPERYLKVYEQPANTLTNLMMDMDGRLTTLAGGPLDPGKLPHGQWVTLADIPPTVATLAPITPFLIERAGYDCASGEYDEIEPAGTPDPWDVGGIQPG